MRHKTMVRTMFAIALLLAAVGCSDDDTGPLPDTGVTADSFTTADLNLSDASLSDGPARPDGPGPGTDGQGAQDQGGQADSPAGAPAFQDDCPPTSAPVKADITLNGQTSAKKINLNCGGGGKPFGQAVALELTQKKKVQLTVTSNASLTSLGVWADCSTFKGCKAGDASSGMTYEVDRDPGTHYILVGTSTAASFTLEIKLLNP